jgi:hypothetical protein
MKFPFIQQTVVALDVCESSVKWVEVDCLGSKLTLVGNGKIEINEVINLKEVLETIADQTKSEAYLLSFSFGDLLLDLMVEDIPYFEESEEIAQWISDRKDNLQGGYESKVLIEEQIIDVDEDHRRCIFQVADQKRLEWYLDALEAINTIPGFISTGVTEPGYSLIYEDKFISGVSSILTNAHEKSFLCTYQNGLIQNTYDFEHIELNQLIEEADSCLRTEEVSAKLPQHTIPLFVPVHTGLELNDAVTRPVQSVSPLQSKTGFSELEPEYTLACGLAVKTFFPDLDGFDFTTEQQKLQAKEKVDKRECYRTGILLFPPLVVIFLLLFAVEGFLDVNLTETNQVLGQLSDKIELVNSKTDEVNGALVSYQQVSSLVEKRRNSARLFEVINEETPTEVWLTNLNIQHIVEKHYKIVLDGIAPWENLIANYMGNLENRDEVLMVELISSQKAEGEDMLSGNQEKRDLNQFRLRVEVAY